ncbi:hypothetical protein DN752_20935 [Echinicola strongylocentroti]|uniref:Uncharacterized protein n=1 Tax=Echinicola strongylocentroti TaxID=1795355 RepID=A0A2Z4IP53_9BACT|nr:hypothetical protein [Echinicola strongylocentroti]AWW32408.1 hypothetical protein DN752_20935 [Echinicola strongylocentroti]
MKSKVADTLTRFANARERAYRASGSLSMAKANAIHKVKNVAAYFSEKSETVQLKAVKQIEGELMLIIPHEQSRFKGLRENIINLIQQCHAVRNNSQSQVQAAE